MARISPAQMQSLLKVYFIAGSTNCLKAPEKVLTDAIDGGVTLFQFREKGEGCLKGQEKLELGKRLQWICKENGIPFIVNDDLELAMELDADGVHIGQEDDDVGVVRKKIGDKILGVSVHNLEEAEKARHAGADYFGVGPIFPTQTKKDARAVQGTVLIEELNTFNIPIVGIGGINAENADVVITTALVPGKKAPTLVTEEMVKNMRSGSVIVDMAVEFGGNCELSEMNKTVIKYGVKIVGEPNLPSLVPTQSSELFSKNILALIEYLTKDGKINLDLNDEIVKESLITYNGEVINQRVKSLLTN